MKQLVKLMDDVNGEVLPPIKFFLKTYTKNLTSPAMAVSESRIRVVLLIGRQALRPLVFLPFWSSVYIHLSDLASPGTDGVGDSCLPLLSPAKREIETGSWPTAPYPSIT